MQYYDVEHWGAHPEAFERLLERLARHPRVVVLGGDVHYGAAYAMDWTGDNGRTSRIVHFTVECGAATTGRTAPRTWARPASCTTSSR